MRNRHKHREEAAMTYFAGLDVSLEETSICVDDDICDLFTPDKCWNYLKVAGMLLINRPMPWSRLSGLSLA
jgi:hypothetical protein